MFNSININLCANIFTNKLQCLSLQQACIIEILKRYCVIESYCVHGDILLINILSQLAPRVFQDNNEYYWWKNEFNYAQRLIFKIMLYKFKKDFPTIKDWKPSADKLNQLKLSLTASGQMTDLYHLDLSHLDITSYNNAFIYVMNNPCVIRMRI